MLAYVEHIVRRASELVEEIFGPFIIVRFRRFPIESARTEIGDTKALDGSMPEKRRLNLDVVDGANPILFVAIDDDDAFLELLGILTPTTILGGEKLDTFRIDILGGTGASQTRTIDSNTATQITVTSAWTTPPDTTSLYRIYKPSAGTVQIFAAL